MSGSSECRVCLGNSPTEQSCLHMSRMGSPSSLSSAPSDMSSLEPDWDLCGNLDGKPIPFCSTASSQSELRRKQPLFRVGLGFSLPALSLCLGGPWAPSLHHPSHFQPPKPLKIWPHFSGSFVQLQSEDLTSLPRLQTIPDQPAA